jgi:hypothetical protein
MLIRARTFQAALLCCSVMLPPAAVRAEGIDTEHLFAFTIGTDVGDVGDREFQSQTTGRFAKNDGHYRALEQELEPEFVPAKNFRIELGGGFSAHDVNGVPDFEDRRQFALQAARNSRPTPQIWSISSAIRRAWCLGLISSPDFSHT